MQRFLFTFLTCGFVVCAGRVVDAQQTRPDSARQKAIQDSIALMRALDSAAAASQPRSGGGQAPAGGATGPTNPRLLPDVSAVGDLVLDASPERSTLPDSARFSIREVELALQAVVDPYFRGDVFLGISDEEGISVEQAFLTTTSLRDYEVRLGRFLMPFGKQNTTHRHDLHTIEYPWALQRLLNEDGLKGTGIAVSRIFAPFGFYQELQLTAVDRLREQIDSISPVERENRSLAGVGYSARLRNYIDINQATNIEISGSALTGRIARPFLDTLGVIATIDGVNATLARQTMFGVDLTFRWRPLQQGLYKSFILQAELIRQLNERRPDARVLLDPFIVVETDRDYTGGYVFGRWQVGRRGFVGARYDQVEDPTAFGRTLRAGSGYFEYFPSEFSKLVAAYERLQPGLGDSVNRLLFQATFALGPHKPHPF